MPRAPQSRSGRYADLDAGQLADIVEQAYEHDDLPDWELVFELSRRVMSTEGNDVGPGAVGVARQGY